jgi:hypothetical protein
MEIRLVDVENCGGVVVTVTGKDRASPIVHVKIRHDHDEFAAESVDPITAGDVASGSPEPRQKSGSAARRATSRR